MTAPTWAEARRAEQEISADETEHLFYRYFRSKAEGDDYRGQAEAKVRAARRASDLALVRETLRHIAVNHLEISVRQNDGKLWWIEGGIPETMVDPAAVLAALEQEGR